MRVSTVLAMALSAAGVLGRSDIALAQDMGNTRAVAWNPRWRRADVAELVYVGALAGGLAAIQWTGSSSKEPNFTGRNFLDDGVRDVLRGRSDTLRDSAKGMGDGIYIGLTVYPTVVEALLLSGLVHRNWDVTAQLVVMHLESALFAGVVTLATQNYVGRARPLVEPCAADPGYDPMCNTTQLRKSFIGGHTALAASGAALVCVHQAHLPLYGSRVAGVVACAAAGVLASGVSLLRIVGDKHWSSDLTAGTLVGATSGVLHPILLHYGMGPLSSGNVHVTPVVTGERAIVVGSLVF